MESASSGGADSASSIPDCSAVWISTGESWRGLKPPLIHAGQLHTLQSGAFPCSDKARRELDWEPKSFSEGVEQTCQFLFPERAAGIERSVGRC